MKRILPLLALLFLPFTAKADQSFFYWCTVGNTTAAVSGLQSTNTLMASYPQCTVTVTLHGTTTLASLFSDNGVTPLANPFTANTDGSYQFYAADGNYDATMSGGLNGGFPFPVTVPNIFLSSGGSGAQSTILVNGVVVPPNVYNFINGTNTVISNPQNGDIRIDSTGGGVCGQNFIPCLNTPNTWLTGIQTFLSSGNNNVPIAVQGFGGGTVTPAYVQGSSTQVSGPFFGCAYTLNGVVAGDAIIAIAWSSRFGTPATISDSASDTYTQAGFAAIGIAGGVTVFVAPSVAGGDTTVTMDQTGEVSGCTVLEYSGLSSSPLDGLTFGVTGSGSSLALGPVITTNPTDIILTATDSGGSTPIPIQPAGYTLNFSAVESPGANRASAASLIVNSTGSYSGTWTNLASGGTSGFIMALKAGGSALYQTADLVQFNDSAGTTHASVNSLGQYVMPSYASGAFNVPDGPALAYNSASNCPEYYDTGTNAWVPFCGTTPPGGSNGSIQANISGAFGAATSAQIATALNGTPQPLIGSTLKGTGLTPGNCLQASTGGLIVDTGAPCGSTGGGITALTGDGTASGTGSVAFTLATVNSGPGACGDATHVCAVTTNGKGLVTAQSAVAITGIGSIAFSSITTGTSTVALHVGTGGTLDATGGSITATAMPYSGLTGSVPTWNQNTTGTAGGLTGSPAITVSNITDSALTSGNCLQATIGGRIVDTGVPCGSGGGGGGITALTSDVNASGTGSVPAVVVGINNVKLSTLATGILKNTTSTGVPSIAVANTDYLTPTGPGTGLTALNASNLASGTVPAARLPNPSASTLGGVQSQAVVASRWISSISTSGVPSVSQPFFSDIAGTIASSQLPLGSSSTVGGLQCGSGTTCSGGVISVAGGGGISGLTPGVLPKALSGTSIGNSLLDETTHSGADTFNGANGIFINGTGPTLMTYGGGSVGFTVGSGVSSVTCTSATCQTARGSISIVGGTATTGTLATIFFPVTLATAPICGVLVNGQTTYLGIGHGAPTTAGFTITSAVSVSGKTVAIDYWCEG